MYPVPQIFHMKIPEDWLFSYKLWSSDISNNLIILEKWQLFNATYTLHFYLHSIEVCLLN